MKLDFAMSPCPNDTFIFHRFLEPGFLPFEIELHLGDVEELNHLALTESRYAITKLSYAAIARLRDRYTLLRSGGALGRGCGPILLSGEEESMEEDEFLSRLKKTPEVLVPGQWTTANLLLQLYLLEKRVDLNTVELRPTRYDRIMPALEKKEASFGVIIHEERFTYPAHGLSRVRDLGDWWEESTGQPIPLGGIMVRKDVGEKNTELIDRKIRESIEYARNHPEKSRDFIKANAQSLEDTVIDSHIGLYVNDYSIDRGEDGDEAVRVLFEKIDGFSTSR